MAASAPTPTGKLTQQAIDLLYSYEHCYGQGERNDIAKKLTEVLGIGDHQCADRIIRVEAPTVHGTKEKGDDWTEYEITVVMNDEA